jgi:hypothetical protein
MALLPGCHRQLFRRPQALTCRLARLRHCSTSRRLPPVSSGTMILRAHTRMMSFSTAQAHGFKRALRRDVASSCAVETRAGKVGGDARPDRPRRQGRLTPRPLASSCVLAPPTPWHRAALSPAGWVSCPGAPPATPTNGLHHPRPMACLRRPRPPTDLRLQGQQLGMPRPSGLRKTTPRREQIPPAATRSEAPRSKICGALHLPRRRCSLPSAGRRTRASSWRRRQGSPEG